LSSLEWVSTEVPQAVSFISGTTKYFLVLNKKIDAVAEKVRLEMELAHAKKFIQSIQVKLDNEKFIQNAKAEVIENEKKKLADGMERLKSLEESLKGL